MNTNILVVGDYESVIIYKSLNCDIACVKQNDNFDSVINQIIEKEYKVIFVIDNYYPKFKEKILSNKLNILKTETAIIPVMGIKNVLRKGNTNVARQKYQELSKIATGLKLREEN